jgi:hypothetical protein
MADDFRVTVVLDDGSGEGFGERLSEYEHELEDEAKKKLGEAVAVSADGSDVFLYSDTLEAARNARDLVAGLLEQDGLTATYALDRWHPLAGEWKPADEPLPETELQREAELDEREAQEEEESRRSGYAEWEVRLDVAHHGDAVDLAEKLESEGIPVTRRWTYVLVGAASEEDANELAERLRWEGPEGTKVHVQPGGEMVWEAAPRRSRIFYFIPNL